MCVYTYIYMFILCIGKNYILQCLLNEPVMSENLRIARTTTDVVNVVIHVNLLLIQIKNTVVCVRRISVLKKIFWKHLPFHRFVDTLNKFIELSSLTLIYICVCIFKF